MATLRWRRTSQRRACSPGEASGGPILAVDAVVREEEAAWVVFRFDRTQARIVRSPIRILPRGVEVIALRHIGASVRGDPAQFGGGLVDRLRILPRRCRIEGGPRQARIARTLPARDDREREGLGHPGIGRPYPSRRRSLRPPRRP